MLVLATAMLLVSHSLPWTRTSSTLSPPYRSACRCTWLAKTPPREGYVNGCRPPLPGPLGGACGGGGGGGAFVGIDKLVFLSPSPLLLCLYLSRSSLFRSLSRARILSRACEWMPPHGQTTCRRLCAPPRGNSTLLSQTMCLLEKVKSPTK